MRRTHRSVDVLIQPGTSQSADISHETQLAFDRLVNVRLGLLQQEFQDVFAYGFEWRVCSNLSEEREFRWHTSGLERGGSPVEEHVMGSGWVKVFALDPTGVATERYPMEPDFDESMDDDAWDAAWNQSAFARVETRFDEWSARVLALLHEVLDELLGPARYRLNELSWELSLPSSFGSDGMTEFTDTEEDLYVLGGHVPIWIDVSLAGHMRALVDLAWVVPPIDWDRKGSITCSLVPIAEEGLEPTDVLVRVMDKTLGRFASADAALYGPVIMRLAARRGAVIGAHAALIAPMKVSNRRANALPDTPAARATALDPLGLAVRVDVRELGIEYQMQTRLGQLAICKFLLEGASYPSERGRAFNIYENNLNASRSDVPWARDELAMVAEMHFAEMAEIRSSLINYRGWLPDVPIFRLMSANAAKRRDWAESLIWAERGIDFYGTQAKFPGSVETLERRAARARKHLQTGEPISLVESLICTACGRAFERERKPGRKPTRCPEC